MLSTRETPDTAASPSEVTMTVSAMPMVMARSCSIINGIIRRRSALPENSGGRVSVRPAAGTVPFMLALPPPASPLGRPFAVRKCLLYHRGTELQRKHPTNLRPFYWEETGRKSVFCPSGHKKGSTRERSRAPPQAVKKPQGRGNPKDD